MLQTFEVLQRYLWEIAKSKLAMHVDTSHFRNFHIIQILYDLLTMDLAKHSA